MTLLPTTDSRISFCLFSITVTNEDLLNVTLNLNLTTEMNEMDKMDEADKMDEL
jgi:hypothetical protein